MAGDRVRCAVCKHQSNAFCMLKKCKVALNKRRKCSLFKIEPGKVKIKEQLPSTRGVSRHLIKDYRKELKKKIKEDELKRGMAKDTQMTPDYRRAMQEGNTKHPLTGDLSRFTSTAGKDE